MALRERQMKMQSRNRLICSLSNTRLLLLSTVHIVKESCCVIDGFEQKAMAAIEHAMQCDHKNV